MKTAARSTTLLLTVLLAVLGIVGASGAATYTFTKLLDDAGELNSLRAPALNNRGQVAFFAYRDEGGEGIYRWQPTGLTTIAATSPGGFHSFLGCDGGSIVYSAPVLDDSGHVAFCAYTLDTLTTDCGEAIYLGNGTWTQAITDSGSGGSVYSDHANPSLSASGVLAFRGRQAGTDVQGLYVVQGGGTQLVVDTSGEFDTFNGVDVNDSGQIAFMAWTDEEVGGIYRMKPGAAPETIALTTSYCGLSPDPMIANGGKVAFGAQGEGCAPGIYTWDGATTLIASRGDTFLNFMSPAIDSSGGIVFWALLQDWRGGIFTGPDAAEDCVVKVGDSLFGSTVYSVETGRNAINASGEIAFLYRLTNGEFGIALATPQGTSAVQTTPPRALGEALALGPPVPNPSRGTVGISFRLPAGAAEPRLAIYDPSGRLVRELDSSPAHGLHRAEWDGRDAAGRQVPAGAYFAKLTSRGASRTTRILMVR